MPPFYLQLARVSDLRKTKMSVCPASVLRIPIGLYSIPWKLWNPNPKCPDSLKCPRVRSLWYFDCLVLSPQLLWNFLACFYLICQPGRIPHICKNEPTKIWFRALITLIEVPGLLPSTYCMLFRTTCNSISREPNTLSWPPQATALMCL